MKDIARRIFEKENQAEVSNNIDKRPPNKSFTQLVSLTLINNERLLRQPKIEYKSIDFKNPSSLNYASLTQRPINIQKPSFHQRPEVKQKTTTNTSSHYSPINRQNTSLSVCTKEGKQHPIELKKLLTNYSEDILEHFLTLDSDSPKEFLKSHTISTNLRAKMVDWMVEVLTSYKCKDQTFFLAVRLMDYYLSKINKSQTPQDLHLIGVTCMFVASKFEEIYPVKLQVVHEKIAHKKLSKDEIREKETLMALTLDFQFVGVTIHDLLTMILAQLNLHQELYQTSIYLAKMSLYEYDFISQTRYALMAAAALIVGTKIVEQVDPTISSEIIVPQIIQGLNIQTEEAMDSANQLLKLAKNFEKQFPNLENLKKFNKFSFQDALKSQK